MAPPNLIGDTLGIYQIVQLIGHGGMASVYRAFDPRLHRPVAIKVLSDDIAAQPGFIDRFHQEARLIAGLSHPNIVQVYDLGQDKGYTYMVQELLPGPTLDWFLNERLARGQQLTRDEIVKIITQLAGALDAAHAAGIIHRDVKPSNAMWNANNTLVLTDFGIAKNMLVVSNKTQTGMVFGTPHYLSPEQAQSQNVTIASDIYSLGVVLYELITGKPPFEGDTPIGVVLKHVQAPPPPLRPARPDAPPAVEAVVQRALAKKPEERFASAGDLARALDTAWIATPTGTTASGDIYNQPTQMVQQGSTPAPVSAPAAPAAPVAAHADNLSVPQQQAPAAPAASHPALGRRKPNIPMPVLIVIFLVLLGGVALSLRGGTSQVAAPGASAPAIGAIETPSAAVAQLPPTTIIAPTAETQPTPLPIETQPAPSTDETTPQPNADPFTQLRDALGASAPALQALDATQQALNNGDTTTATQQLQELQKTILAGRSNGEIDADAMRQALRNVAAIAAQHGIELPLQIGS
jgi:serine/threonine-protein kinase